MGACGDLRHADKALGKCRYQRILHESLAYSDIMLRSERVAPSELLGERVLGAAGTPLGAGVPLGETMSGRSKPRLNFLHYMLLGLVEM